jgi:hypothetical protein
MPRRTVPIRTGSTPPTWSGVAYESLRLSTTAPTSGGLRRSGSSSVRTRSSERSRSSSGAFATEMAQNRFPPGWDEERVQKVLARYETQSEAETVAEDEAFERPGQTVMGVPTELVPAIRELIAKHRR